MPKTNRETPWMAIAIGVAVTVISAAAIKVWDNHDTRIAEVADLKARVNALEDQMDDVYKYSFNMERPKPAKP
jgi:hypothetical protein